jgi:branched-chain amino acid transport system substrate-binding protein
VVAAQFANSKGAATAYAVHDKTAYGQGIAEFFKREAENLGMQVLGFEGTEEKANFDSILAPLVAANPDVVFFGGIYDQAAVMFKQAREKGYQGMLLSDDGFDSPESVNIGGASLLEGGGLFYSPLPSCCMLAYQVQTDFEAKYGMKPLPFT